MHLNRSFNHLSLLLLVVALHASASALPQKRSGGQKPVTFNAPAPQEVIGFTPGDDRKLASWAQMIDYFRRLAATSDRLLFQELGKTTLGKPFVLITISSPANLARLDHFKEIQQKLADPRRINNDDRQADKLIAEGRTIVMITCGIHSTEVGGNLVSMNIAYKLVSDDSAETQEILDKCIILLVPSLNPDGVDIVKKWYDKTLGTPSEGTNPPELYHHYAGHDNNRDWYAFTQVETQLTVDKVQNVWHPQIVHDIHQQGESASRFFIPPYTEPWEPNVPPIIQAGVNFMGSAMAWEMINQAKPGVVINGVYDAWSPARAYQHYHAGIRILSETASCRIATPINIPFERLTPQIGVNPKIRSWNFPLVWQGGEWTLANIVDYMQSGAFALLRNAARYRERWLRGFYEVGKDAVRARKPGEAFAFLIPPPDALDRALFWQTNGLERLLAILKRGEVEVTKAGSAFTAAGRSYPAGTAIVLMSQPYGAFAKTLLERQQYPDLREYPGGPPRRPYDVTAQTLPLLMGVNAVRIDEPFSPPGASNISSGSASGVEQHAQPRVGLYKSHFASMDEGWTRWILDQYRDKLPELKLTYRSVDDAEIRGGDLRARFDCIVLPAQTSQQIFNGLAKDRYPADIAGGVGAEGVEAMRKFIDDGGTVVTLNDASQFAIEHLGVPVKNVLEGVSAKDFYCPGSILKLKFDASSPVAQGLPPLDGRHDEGIAWFEGGPAFETTSAEARVIARFADPKEVLLSGWLLGSEKIGGKGAIVEVKRGKGRVVMFAFRPQYRGQSVATLPFFFNAISQ